MFSDSRALWQAAMAYSGVVVAVVIAARAGLYPGVGVAYPGQPLTAHPYRVAMGLTALALAIGLGLLAAGIGRRYESALAGLAALLAGGITTGLILAAAPWTLYPDDRYPVPFLWLMVGAPVGLLVWGLATLLKLRK